MAQSSEEQKFTVRLLIDEEKKNKVVLAEAGTDFVDVLFSLLKLPMGNIIKLLEKYRKSEIGCFSNLYKSVVDMSIDDFETEACKQMLLNPRSVKEEVHCKRLNGDDDHLKFFKCRHFSGCNLCSNFSSSVCACGELMNQEIELSKEEEEDQVVTGKSSFIITDDLKVSVDSTGLVLKMLDRLGCSDVSKLEEQVLDIGLEEIVTLLESMFSSNTPLTDAFLKKQSPDNVNIVVDKLVVPKTDEREPEFTLDAIVRKQDMKILYVECGEDFVDLLFMFLAVPLEYLCDIDFGCIGNLHRSFKDLSVVDSSASKCVLPYYYKCQKQFSDITIEEPPDYYRYRNSNPRQPDYSLTMDSDRSLLYRKDRLVLVTLIDPKSNGSGFVKRGTRFTVSDDLMITPKSSLSTSIGLLKKLQIRGDDIAVQAIRIGKTEAMSLLRASLVRSSALNYALRNLFVKKPKEEN